ncbi:MAG: hypothetical protein LQ345_000137 [Seirophora villosa]|nr:MAG: hypothetical protein LQ345_000137 [Seirophora villosa]
MPHRPRFRLTKQPSGTSFAYVSLQPFPPYEEHVGLVAMLRGARDNGRLRRYLSSCTASPLLRSPTRRHLATASPASDRTLAVGQQLHGFTLQRQKHVPELQLTAYDLRHDRTGAEYLHIDRDDKNNVFSISFKTNPPDDTGVPHILEHTTLCGSETYPVRDPFFKMLPRSLSNFMNAFTSSDHTSYPFATTNRKDFNNLLSVYLDATLNPLLKENDFAQEGWRIGPANPGQQHEATSAEDPLVFKGVVYNEMKGQMSDASYLYYIKFQDHIFPAINNSGGDPRKMTDLTYAGLKDFHAKNYHPSNAKLFTYGNMPLADHITEISQRLERFSRSQADKEIKIPVDLSAGPLEYTVKGPIDPLVDKDMQYKTSTSWLMGDTSDTAENFALRIMSSLLLDGYGSPLYRDLIESGLGPDWSPNTGYDAGGRVGIFSVGLIGVKREDVQRVKEVIMTSLQKVHLEGFDQGKVDGLLHQAELGLKHNTANFGMGIMQRLQPGWFNGVDPLDMLAWNDTVSTFKANYARQGYLEGLLEKYLLNDKCLVFTMEPDTDYGAKLVEEENARLSSIFRSMGGESEARAPLIRKESELLEAQSRASTEDLSCLPSVHVSDIPRQMQRKTVRDSKVEDISVQWREASTNGLTYFRAINVLQGLPGELRMLMPLFTDSLMRLGTKNRTMEQLEDLIKLKTGGIAISYHSTTSPHDIQKSTEGLSLSGYALDGNISAMYELLGTIIQETDFDGPEAESRVRELLQSAANGALDAIAGAGHSYARRYTEAALTSQGLLNEQIGGLTQVQQTGLLASRPSSEGLGDVLSKLKTIQRFALSNSTGFRTAITCGPEAVSHNASALRNFLSNLDRSSTIPSSGDSEVSATFYNAKTFFPLPYQVYYSALSVPTVPYTHPDSAALQVLSQLLTHKHLHHEIREKGGAYGGGAYSRGLSGLFGFYSYRDPNPLNTLKIVQDAGRWARDKQWTKQDLEEAKLSVFQGVDAPESISEEGMTRFVSGVDEDMEQRKREQLLDIEAQDVADVAQTYLVAGMAKARVAVLGAEKGLFPSADGWSSRGLHLAQDLASEPVD